MWVHGHCHPEFYLENEQGEGRWFPCQAVGKRAFGEMPDLRPILQKGDDFRVPEEGRQRFVAEYLNGKAGGGNPQVNFVRQILLP